MSETYKYKTIQAPSKGEYKEKGSKFIGFAHPINSEEEFKTVIKTIKEEYADAIHHCYAFCYGVNQESYRYSDDGEPSGTAGKPIYGQILSHEITNVCIVVIRYFGGTKLGVGGLITAYKTAALEALSNAQIIEKELEIEYTIEYNYEDTSFIERALNDFNAIIIKKDFSSKCYSELRIPLNKKEEFEQKLNQFIIKKE